MNIGFFTDTYFPQISGVSTSIRTLRDELVKKGHRVIIFTTTDPDADSVEEDVVRLPSIPFISFKDRRIAYSGFDRVLKIAKKYHLDLVHTHTEFSLGLMGQYVANRLQIPIIHTYHTMYEKYTHYILDGELVKPEHVRTMTRIFCRRVNGIIAPSQMTYDTLREYGIKTKMRVIPTGVNIPFYSSLQRQHYRKQYGFRDSDFLLLSLSRISKEKNIDDLIKYFPDIHQQHPNTHLLIVGDGPARKSLEELTQSMHIEEKIHFIGEVDHNEINRFYQMADLYVNSSDSESQGLTYLEALVNRIPICALYNDYLADVLSSSEDLGILFHHPKEFATVANNFLTYRKEHNQHEITKETLNCISSEHFANNVFSFYETIICNQKSHKMRHFGRFQAKFKEFIRKMVIGDDT